MVHACMIVLELSLTIAAAKHWSRKFLCQPPIRNNAGPGLACFSICLFFLFYMVYKGRMAISFIPLHARMTWHAHVVFFVGSSTILTQMINLEDLFRRFESLRTKLSPKQYFRDVLAIHPIINVQCLSLIDFASFIRICPNPAYIKPTQVLARCSWPVAISQKSSWHSFRD